MRFRVEKSLPLAALTLLAACGGGGDSLQSASAQIPANSPASDYPMVLGPAFTVDGETYVPVDKMNYDAVGHAVVGVEGGAAVTAAHRTLPLPSYIEVTALDTGKTILVRVERRGPMTGKGLVELSPGAAAQLGVVGRLDAPIRVRRMNPPEPDRAALRSGMPASARMDTPKSLLAVLQRKLDQQEGVITREPVAEPTAVAAATLPPKPEAKGRAKPQPKPRAPVVAAAAATPPAVVPAAAPSVSAKGKYLVQVGAFSSKANADNAAKKSGGTAVQVGKLWRVRVGPVASEADAKLALAKVKGAGYSDARIQRAD
ncbi:MAG: SPOR domain-containing protein [Novosphingobium sp.]